MNYKNLTKIIVSTTACLLLTACKTTLGDYTSEYKNSQGQHVVASLTLKLNNTCSLSFLTRTDGDSYSVLTEPECTWKRYENAVDSNLIILTLKNELVEGHVKYYNLLVVDNTLVNRENADIVFHKK